MKHSLMGIAGLCLLVSVMLGITNSVVVALPVHVVDIIPFQRMRPLHTLFAFGWVVAGTLTVAQAAVGRRPDVVQVLCFAVSIAGAGAAVAIGEYSGREYLSWPPVLSIPMGVAMVLGAVGTLRGLAGLARRAPEPAWLIGVGIILLPLGFAEAHLYLIDDIGVDVGRDLAVQWQAIDTMIGAWNAVLYGVGALVLAPSVRRPMPWLRWLLFAVAVSGLLLTFSHHHYPSPQSRLLKDIAFWSSLLAAVAFGHHLVAWLRRERRTGLVPLLVRSAAGWTLVSVATGFLMAIPPINVITHGTYVVVAHAMGSMIGVNTLLLLAAGFAWMGRLSTRRELRLANHVRLLNLSLSLLVGLLMTAGVLKGVLRLDHGFWATRDVLVWFLYPLPLVGCGLAVGMLPLALELLNQVSAGHPLHSNRPPPDTADRFSA